MSESEHSYLAPTSADPVSSSSRRIGGRLKLYFASLACLGGLVLTSGSSIEPISVFAVFFAVFGYVFVDWLELFALPTIAAYAAMGLATLYCVSDFVDLDAPGNHQMLAVAQLLVLVQSILMLQRKTRRILEQLGVFCLLQLIVAAVFNNAIHFGLLLIPISIIGAWALSSLAALSASDGIMTDDGLDDDHDAMIGFRRNRKPPSVIRVSAPESVQSLSEVALRLPRVALLTVAPSVVLVGAIFFYALPRTTDAARGADRGNALVGFTNTLRLEQIGQMMQSSAPAMRIRLTERATGEPYLVDQGIYLRGRVLERYRASMNPGRNSAEWTALHKGSVRRTETLPREFVPLRSTDEHFYDSVQVQISCESSRSSALFAIAPYYYQQPLDDVEHCLDRWTLDRRGDDDWVYPRITYEFGTHAFRRGMQTDLISQIPPDYEAQTPRNRLRNATKSALGKDSVAGRQRLRDVAGREQQLDLYVERLVEFDIDAMPTTAELAERLATDSPHPRTEYQIAKRMEAYLATSGDFQYTLNLDSESYPGLDPIEQFVLIDKRGHCQYFASALAMMLRSQKIPARIVVGYHTDEYNEIGDHYVARQLHAHAWVEALIPRDQIDRNRTIYGQPEFGGYWMRLDPTPGAGRQRENATGVGQVLDLAQNMWDDYVVEMDGKQQKNVLLGDSGSNPLQRSYAQMISTLSNSLRQIRAGELGGGVLAKRALFSWPAAVLGVGLTLVMALVIRMPTPRWIRRRIKRDTAFDVARPQIPFYAATLDQLSRIGVFRAAAQTPSELAFDASARMQQSSIPPVDGPLRTLTDAFYQRRFGTEPPPQETRPDLEPIAVMAHASQEESAEVTIALGELTRSVDLMIIGQQEAEQKA